MSTSVSHLITKPVLKSLISLEPLQHFHGQKILQLMDESICQFLGRQAASNLQDVMAYIHDYNGTQPVRFAIKHQAFGFIGVISFGCIKKEPLEAVIGYWIGRPYQGFGYARQAINQLLAMLAKINVSRVLAEVYPENTRSEKLLENVGFRCADKTSLHNGQWQFYYILRDLNKHNMASTNSSEKKVIDFF